MMICWKLNLFLLVLAGTIVASTGLASAQIVALGHSAVRGHVAENEMRPAVLERVLRVGGSQVHEPRRFRLSDTPVYSAPVGISEKVPNSGYCLFSRFIHAA
jgi:hypothetical protein